jgi:hypothetical protein
MEIYITMVIFIITMVIFQFAWITTFGSLLDGPPLLVAHPGICRRWCALLHPSGLAWRAATTSVASVAARNGSAVVQWTGVELLMPIKEGVGWWLAGASWWLLVTLW